MSESVKTGLFQGGTYHSQLRAGPDPENYDGEYRGFYPGDPGWRPASSHHLGRSAAKPHRGVDIYAPYAPHPLETPVCAIVDGTLDCRDGLTEPQELGNRVELKFGANNEKLFSYGHLSRFEGRDGRPVKAGEIIGYAGCSGNADTQRECSECGACNINSGHVHLSVRGPAGMDRNPLAHCSLRLRFGPADPLLAEKKCSAWVNPATGPGLAAAWEPAPPRAAKLLGGNALNWRRDKGKRVPLDGPFALLEFDSTRELETTRKFYAKCVERLAKLAALPNPQSADDKALKKLLERIGTSAVGELRDAGKARLEAIRKRIGEAGQVKGLAVADDASLVPGWLLRHLAALAQMTWIAFGGAALDRLADNDGGTASKPTYALLPQIGDKGAYPDLRAWHLPQCGAGLGGAAWLSASETARNALHFTKLNHRLAGGVDRPYWIGSITFGAGSLMHATISELMMHPVYGGATSVPAHDAAIANYIQQACDAAALLWAAHITAHAHQVTLSNELGAGPDAAAKREAALEDMRKAIVDTADALVACHATIGSDELAKALLLRLAQSNAKLFEDLVKKSRETEGPLPIGPGFFMLRTVEAN